VRRTTQWARRQRDADRADGQLRFAINQGGTDRELRRRSTEELVDLHFDGNAIGGSRSGEDRARCSRRRTGRLAAPRGQAALLHGHRRPEGILEVIEAGVDMFDCVLPTRTARTGSALTWQGRSTSATRATPATARRSTRLRLPACTRFTRAYIRHLVNQSELLGLRLPDAPQSTLPRSS
jgi:queuine tRNA-ribosyltransferase